MIFLVASGKKRNLGGKLYKLKLVGGIKNRLKISVFYGEKVVHLADI